MSGEELSGASSNRIPPIQTENRVDPSQLRPGSGARMDPSKGAEFSSLLERLQRMRAEGKTPAPPGPEGSENSEATQSGQGETSPVERGSASGEDSLRELGNAMKEADRAHETAMDIKRRLEAAFRKATGQ
jgi:hypothetical protein